MARGKKIYVGQIKSLRVKDLIITDETKELEYVTTVLKENALFYRNKLQIMISLDHDTKLPDYQEAVGIIESAKNKQLMKIPYMDEDEVVKTSYVVSNKEFKKIKKYHKQKNNQA